jgi:hypothetical protein
MLSMKDVVSVNKTQVAVDLKGEVVVLNTDSGIYYSLDEVGARIWDLIQTPVSIEFLRDTIIKEYAVDEKQCVKDLLSLLGTLKDAGLLEVRD